MNTNRPDLGVAIVSYNTRDLLERCLNSLAADLTLAGLSGEVWVVDNGSADGSADMVGEHYPDVRLIASETNLGFARANNVVLERWAADDGQAPRWVLLLNPDTEIRAGALPTLVDALTRVEDAAVAGPSLVYPDGSFQHSAFRFPGLVQTTLDLFPVARLMDRPVNGRYRQSRYDSGKPFTVDFPLGACMLVRQRAMARVGVLDARYFMYCEEIDWCRRFQAAGYRALCVPAAVVVHHAGASTRQFGGEMFTALWRSRTRYFRRHELPPKRWALLGAVRLGLRLRAAADRLAEARGRLTHGERVDRRSAYRAVFDTREP